MKSLIFFALICACAALPRSFIGDTPAVQQEKRRHFELFNAAAAAAAAAPDTNVNPHQQYNQHHHSGAVHRFAGPQHHHQAHQTYQPHQPHQPHQQKWTGPVASSIPAGLPGSPPQVANTPEVEAATANFHRAFNAAVVASKSAAPHQNAYQGSYTPAHQPHSYQPHSYQPHSASTYQKKWTGPLASSQPAGLPGSPPQVQDTPEVLAAKRQFGQTYQNELRNTFG